MAETKKIRKPDQTIPGGCTIRGGYAGDDGEHYGGYLQDSEGRVLDQFEDDEVNPGRPRPKAKAKGDRDPGLSREDADKLVEDTQKAIAEADDRALQAERKAAEAEERLRQLTEEITMGGIAKADVPKAEAPKTDPAKKKADGK